MIKTINVTQRDIDKGIKNDCFRCPIARAIKRVFFRMVDVNDCVVLFENKVPLKFKYRVVKLPKEATSFIRKFDNGKEVFPFKFKMEIPE